MLVSRVSFSKRRGCCLFVCVVSSSKTQTKMDDGKTRRGLNVLLDIKNSKPTRTCTRSNVRTMGVVATVDFFFAMVVCFAAAFFLSRRDSLLLLRTIFPPSLPPPLFHLSLSLISSLSFSLSLPFFVFSRIFSFNFLPHSFRAFSLLCVDDFDVCFCCSLFKYYI